MDKRILLLDCSYHSHSLNYCVWVSILLHSETIPKILKFINEFLVFIFKGQMINNMFIKFTSIQSWTSRFLIWINQFSLWYWIDVIFNLKISFFKFILWRTVFTWWSFWFDSWVKSRRLKFKKLSSIIVAADCCLVCWFSMSMISFYGWRFH